MGKEPKGNGKGAGNGKWLGVEGGKAETKPICSCQMERQTKYSKSPAEKERTFLFPPIVWR